MINNKPMEEIAEGSKILLCSPRKRTRYTIKETFMRCDNCGALLKKSQQCEVPMATEDGEQPVTEWFVYCCVHCYDAVCEEEGYNPQEDK